MLFRLLFPLGGGSAAPRGINVLTARVGANPTQPTHPGGTLWYGGTSDNVLAVQDVTLEPDFVLVPDAVVEATFVGPDGQLIGGSTVVVDAFADVAGAYRVNVGPVTGVAAGRYLGVLVTLTAPDGTTRTLPELGLTVV